MHFRLDYGNGVLAGVPAHLMYRLQSVLNASAQLIFNLKCSDHISDAVIYLHWLPVQKCIQYKIAVLMYKVLCGTAPCYLGPLTSVASVPGWRSLHSVKSSLHWHKSSLHWHQPSGRAARQTINCRQQSISGCRLADLEFTAWRHDIGIDSAIIPAAAENSSVQTVFLCTVALLVALTVISYLGHSK